MNPFDEKIIHFLNQFSQKSPFFDHAINVVSNDHFLTGAFVTSIFWWAWFRDERKARDDRQLIIAGIYLSVAGLFLARILAFLLPFRERPLRNPLLHFRIPLAVDLQNLLGWSAFPSDHAVLFFALATSILFLSRRLGILIYFYVFFVGCVPRIYQGLHYPTDILVGALLGTGIACLALINRLRTFLSSGTMHWFERSPATFYPYFFLLTFLFARMFDPLRSVVLSILHARRFLVHH